MRNAIVLLALALAQLSAAQNKYYKEDSGKLFDEAQYQARKLETLELFRKDAPSAKITESFSEAYRTQDSIVLDYRWNIELAAGEVSKMKLHPLRGKKFPWRGLKTLDGKTFDPALLGDRPTLVNFWYANCMPCLEEMPVLNDIKKKYEGRVNFVAVTYEKTPDVKKFLAKRPFDFIHIADAKSVIDKLGIKEFPKNVLIAQDGSISSVLGGIPMTMESDGKLKITDGIGLRLAIDVLLNFQP